MQFLDLTSGLRVAVFVAVNDWFWPNFTVHANPGIRSFPGYERQVCAQSQTWQTDSCTHLLTGSSKANNAPFS